MTAAFLFARGIAFGSLILMILSTFRYGWTQTATSFRLLCVGLLSYIVIPLFDSLTVLQSPLIMIAVTVPLLFWWFCFSLFQDWEFRNSPRKNLWIAFVISYLLISWTNFAVNSFASEVALPASLLFLIAYGLRIALLAAALYCIFRQWQADLVAERRSFRLLLIGLGGLYMLAVLVTELGLGSEVVPMWLETLNAAGLALILLGFAAWIQLSDSTALFATEQATRQSGPKELSEPSVQERAWLAQLNALLEDEKIYRESGLSIVSLAKRVGAPEHRLRRLINRQLGYRNFNDYLNHYRLSEAASKLSDPAYGEIPILTIALESGFSSINPFNRAFKSRYQRTPSEFRRRQGSS